MQNFALLDEFPSKMTKGEVHNLPSSSEFVVLESSLELAETQLNALIGEMQHPHTSVDRSSISSETEEG